jgi:hypothetical protein
MASGLVGRPSHNETSGIAPLLLSVFFAGGDSGCHHNHRLSGVVDFGRGASLAM